jgi:hypothetical protein
MAMPSPNTQASINEVKKRTWGKVAKTPKGKNSQKTRDMTKTNEKGSQVLRINRLKIFPGPNWLRKGLDTSSTMVKAICPPRKR